MAILSVRSIPELLKKQAKEAQLRSAISHEERLSFHCDPVLESNELSPYHTEFIQWVGSFLPADKMHRFKQLLRTPIETVDFTESIFTEYVKVFEAQNKYIKVDFISDEVQKDYGKYFNNLGDNDFWSNDGFEALKQSINSYLVVDVPSVQIGPRPEPYYYFLDVRSVWDVDFDRKGNVEYIIFCQNDGTRCVYDAAYYRRYKKNEISKEWDLIFESEHSIYDANGTLISGIGYTPVSSFYHSTIKNSGGVNKKSPITNALSKLDWLLFWAVSKKYLDLYGAYPIFASYKEKCKYRNEQDYECVEGYTNVCTNIDRLDSEDEIFVQKKCPVCEARSIIGPGSYWTADAPEDKDDVDLMKNPIQIVEMSNQKLEYGVKEVERLRNEIFLDCVGYDGEARHDIAKNETQVYSGFESKRNILMDIKRNYEITHQFAIDTICKIRYGKYFLRSTVDYGTVFYLQSTANLIDQFSKGKEAGLPIYELGNLMDQYNRTSNRNNPEQLHRNYILQQLEPYPEYTLIELSDMGIGEMDFENFALKANFNTFIRRFERENINIIEFGSLTSFSEKINSIKTKLLSYVRESKIAPIPRPEPGANGKPPVKPNGGNR